MGVDTRSRCEGGMGVDNAAIVAIIMDHSDQELSDKGLSLCS